MTIRNNVSSSTGTFDAVAAAGQVSGTAIFMGNTSPRVKNLSAKVVVDGETDTITIAAKWQVSADNSTWVDVANGTQNAAAVVLVTGTAGADAAVTRVMQAPDAVYGWSWARIALVVGVATGTTSDTYTIGYAYRQVSAGEGGL